MSQKLEAKEKDFSGDAVVSEKWIDTDKLQQKALSLFMIDELSKEDYKTFIKLIYSPDYENRAVAETMIHNIIVKL